MNQPFSANYYLDAVGRRRKLSAGAILSVQNAFRDGAKTADLAAQYGVSTTLIRTITYCVPRASDAAKIDEARRALQQEYAGLLGEA